MMTMNRNLQINLFLVLVTMGSIHARSEIYQCIDSETGNRTFSDTACPDKSQGSMIQVGPTNAADPFASESEIAANRKARAIEKSKFKKNWQSQNADAADQKRRDEEKVQKRMRDFEEMSDLPNFEPNPDRDPYK